MKNNITIFALSSNQELAHSMADILGTEVGKSKVHHFADGEILVEIEESNHFVIRKYVKIGDKEYFDGLENDKEYDIALSHFLKKHKNLI